MFFLGVKTDTSSWRCFSFDLLSGTGRRIARCRSPKITWKETFMMKFVVACTAATLVLVPLTASAQTGGDAGTANKNTGSAASAPNNQTGATDSRSTGATAPAPGGFTGMSQTHQGSSMTDKKKNPK
jgi:hypothetical protein